MIYELIWDAGSVIQCVTCVFCCLGGRWGTFEDIYSGLSTFWVSQLQSRFCAIHQSVCFRSYRKIFVFVGPLSVQSLRSVSSLFIFLDFRYSLVACAVVALYFRVLPTDFTNCSVILEYRSRVREPCLSGF